MNLVTPSLGHAAEVLSQSPALDFLVRGSGAVGAAAIAATVVWASSDAIRSGAEAVERVLASTQMTQWVNRFNPVARLSHGYQSVEYWLDRQLEWVLPDTKDEYGFPIDASIARPVIVKTTLAIAKIAIVVFATPYVLAAAQTLGGGLQTWNGVLGALNFPLHVNPAFV